MYKRILLACLFFSAAISMAMAQKPVLKSVDFKDFEKANSEQELALQKRVFSEYDRNGKLLRQQTFGRNQLGELVKQQTVLMHEDKKGKYQKTNNYDSLGNATREDLVIFDKAGKKTRTVTTEYLASGTMQYYSLYTYNEKGKITSVKSFDFLNRLSGEEEHTYDKNNQETSYWAWSFSDAAKKTKMMTNKMTSYNEDGDLLQTEITKTETSSRIHNEYKEIIKFDNNQMAEWTKFKNGEKVSQYIKGMGSSTPKSKTADPDDFANWATETEYDDFGNKSRTTYTEQNPETGESTTTQVNDYSYDDNNNLISTKKTFYEPAGERIEEDRTDYDEFNNIVRTAKYLNDEVVSENIFNYEYHN